MSLKEQVTQPSEPSYRTIPLTQGQVAIVDAADYEWLSQWKWCAWWNPDLRSFYAIRGCQRDGKQFRFYMHRVILGLVHGDKRQADHREPSQTLNNRRSNLRIATGAQNSHNTRRHRDNKSGFKGIHLHKPGRWRSRIMVRGKVYNLGSFSTPELAYAAYCEAAKRLHGEFAHLG
jgi:hypothetical protein